MYDNPNAKRNKFSLDEPVESNYDLTAKYGKNMFSCFNNSKDEEEYTLNFTKKYK